MTTAATPARPATAVMRPAAFRPLILDVARSEWTKLCTVRSTYWTLLVTAVCMTAFGGLLTAAYVNHYPSASHAARATFDPAAYSLSGFFIAQLSITVLGVVIITSEYATGSVRSTFAAAPQRHLVLAAKAIVFGAVAAATGIASSFGSFFAGQAILSRMGIQAHLSDPGALRPVIGAGLYLAVVGLLALGLGTLVRRTAGAIATVVGVIIILPVIVQGLPSSWQDTINPYLPSTAGQAIIGRTKFTSSGHLLAPWTGFAVFCAYTAAVLITAAVALHRRDP